MYKTYFLTLVCILSLSANAKVKCSAITAAALIVAPYTQELTVIIGTDRKGSNSAVVAKNIITELNLTPNTKINIVDLAELPASIFKSDYFSKKSAVFQKNFVDPITRSSGLIFIIPEYDGAVPGILSYYMNHMRQTLDKKQVALVGLSAGKWGARSALDTFKATLTHRRARVLGDLQINIENVETKIANSLVTDTDTQNRLKDTAKQIAQSLKNLPDSVISQKNIALVASTHIGSKIKLQLNNLVSIHGVISNVILNPNGTASYVQFSGPSQIKNNGHVITGQDIDVHNQGYGMPVGKIKKFNKEWYKKNNLALLNLKVGEPLKFEYESGITVAGTLKKLTHDTDGNLSVITFTDVTAKNGTTVLFDKTWGDFDIAVADYIDSLDKETN